MPDSKHLFYHAFKIEYEKIVGVLTTKVHLRSSLIKDFKQYNAVWDTGATNTVITPNVVADLQLQPIDVAEVFVVNNITPQKVDVYLVDIGLPNKVAFRDIRVTCSPVNGCDLLIGMDLIQQGDFSIAKKFDGKIYKTIFSYCIPSHSNPVDLLEKSEAVNCRHQSKHS